MVYSFEFSTAKEEEEKKDRDPSLIIKSIDIEKSIDFDPNHKNK